jgi:hypothetical protein
MYLGIADHHFDYKNTIDNLLVTGGIEIEDVNPNHQKVYKPKIP